MKPYFPLFIPLDGERAVVIGAGRVACRRVESLLPFGAEITVIAPDACPAICALAEQGQIRLLLRGYAPGDLAGARIAVAAADSRAVNHAVSREASAAGIPVSVADCRGESTFYFPGIAREGTLVAGITASGTDHRLAARASAAVRECFRKLFSGESGGA